MINFVIVLFLASLFGIVFMITRKLRLLSTGQAMPEGEHLQMPRFEDLGKIALVLLRRFGYFLLVESIRVYVRLGAAWRRDWEKLKVRIKAKLETHSATAGLKHKNKFLQMLADYKRRVKHIKEQVREEEDIY